MAAADAWKFVYVADVQSGLTPSNAVNTNVCVHMARQIVRENPDLFLLPGDLVYGNTNVDVPTMLAEYVQWSNAFSAVYAAGIPIYPVRGNHEPTGDDTNATAYLTVFGASVPNNGPAGEVGLTYSFVHNNALFICLDEYKYPHQVNQPWLDSQLATRSACQVHQAASMANGMAWLASNRYAHIFVFGHEPAVQTDAPTCLAIENAKRDLFLKSITDAGCRMYLCGHDHLYNRGRLFPRSGGSIMQVVCGSGGAPFSTWSGIYGQDFHEQDMGSNCYYSAFTNGYVLITVSNFNVKLEWKGSTDLETWTTYDTYSYQVTNPATRNPTDFDGDHKADPVAYNAASGVFTVFPSGSSYAPSSVIMGIQPSALSQPVPGDFDGDGKADPAVYDPIAGQLLVRSSAQSYSLNTMPIGNAGCVPVVGDFDGDGKADPALYSTTTSLFAAWLSGSGYAASVIIFGGAGWLNASADYDGDGKTDPAVYRPQTGEWLVLQSSRNYAAASLVTTGDTGMVPAIGDYDGDGKADPTVYNDGSTSSPQAGLWLTALSSQNYTQTLFNGFANSTFLARPADYDGDGKTDPAVYDPGLPAYCAWLSGSGYAPAILSW